MTSRAEIKKDRPFYYIVLDYVDEATGKRRRKWITTEIPVIGNNKRKANARAKEVLADYNLQKTDLSKDAVFTEFMEIWLETLRHSIAPSTYDAYKFTIKAHILPFFGPKKLKVRDIAPAHIQQYINSKMKTLSANTVRKHLVNISKCLDSAVKQNMIAFNPAQRVEKPKKVRYTGAKRYNEEQIEQLLACSKGDPLEIVILLTVFYGLRRSEVLGLKWSAVDMDNDTITIKHTVVVVGKNIHMNDTTKNDSSYAVIPMPERIKAEFKRWRVAQLQHKLLQPNDYSDSGYICTQMDGRLIKPNYVSQHFQVLLHNHDLPKIRFHDLRHSSAGYLKYLGFDLKDIQTWLRHKDIQTTMNIYVNLDMTAKRNIANSLNEKFAKFG